MSAIALEVWANMQPATIVMLVEEVERILAWLAVTPDVLKIEEPEAH